MPHTLRWIFKCISILIALFITVCATVIGITVFFNAPPENLPLPDDVAMRIEENGNLIMEIRSGETSQSVGRRLENAGIIKSRIFWDVMFRLNRGEHIKTGTYRIELPASQIRIRSILIAGEQILVRVTIPEGVTLKKASAIFEDAGICPAEDFLAAAASREILDAYNVSGSTMEGYLFPDTYLFPLAYPAARVVSVMADTFKMRLEEISGDLAPMSAEELNNRIIIASIVEREYRVPDEAAVMAGVFFNRLEIGMPLQSCATVEYVITEILGRPHPEVLYYRDLEIRNPYNTYMRPGLPPGPISAPGETALRAAFNPAQTAYLYFRLIDPSSGRHYFSRTLDDHIRAGVLYVKGR